MATQEENTRMFEEREELMIPSNGNIPELKMAHFLKPTLDPRNQILPKHPFQSLSSKLNIKDFKKRVAFKGRPIPQENWHLWVGNLQQIHESTWKKVGIFDAIKASTYCLMRDNELIIGLAEKWCPETNTFVFTWGECTITLEDVMILGGFSVLGDCVKTPFQSREIEEIENRLIGVFPEDRKNCIGRITQNEWMDYFTDMGGELEHMAFLVLWLSRYVFSTNYFCGISPHVFPIAITLARGNKLALAPAILASIYRDLSMLKGRIVDFVNGNDNNVRKLVLWAPFQLVQLWAWERFPTLCPEPILLFHGEPRLARWQNLKKLENKLSVIDFESLGESFSWRPYALFVENWELPEFYGDEERLVVIDYEVREELLSFAKCLRPCELVGLDCIEHYLPQRVGMQFGLDQDIPSSIPRLNDTIELAWSTYNVPLDGVKLYLSPRLVKGDVTAQYIDWFRTAFSLSNDSVLVFSRQRSLRSRQGEERSTMSKNLDAVVVYNSKHAPLASCSFHSGEEIHVDAEEMNMDSTPCDKRASPSRSYVENSECTPSECLKETKIKLSKNLDQTAERNNLFSVDEMLTEATTSCNKETPTLSNNDVDNSECFPFQCPMKKAKNTMFQNSSGSAEDNSKADLPTSDKNNSLNESHPDNNEAMSSRSLDIIFKRAVSGMDLLMEQVEKCRERCVNMSSNRSFHSVAEMHIKTMPSCDKDISPSKRPDNSYLGVPSQSTVKVVSEVSSSINSLIVEVEEHRKIDHADMNLLQEADLHQDETLIADLEDATEVITNDDQSKATQHLDVKLANGSVGDPVIIDDDEVDKANGHFSLFEVLGPELDARISKLERTVSRMQAAKLVSKGS